ncbi:MAG: DUF2188 domain-containing protein [Bacteroidia bacterium]
MANQLDNELGVCLHVVRHNEKWAVKAGEFSLPSFIFDSRDEAIRKARELSLTDEGEVIVHSLEQGESDHKTAPVNGSPPDDDNFKIFRHPKGWAVSNGSVEHPLFIYPEASDAISKAKELSQLYSKPFSFRSRMA